jgi:hypothetical protein
MRASYVVLIGRRMERLSAWRRRYVNPAFVDASIDARFSGIPGASIASPAIGLVMHRSTDWFGIVGSLATARSKFLALVGATGLLGIRHDPLVELRADLRVRPESDPAIPIACRQ